MSIELEQFHEIFFEESREGLDTMEHSLLQASKGEIDLELINTIFRAAHSIKGGSGTFGFTKVTEFTHLMETILDEVRDGKRQLTDNIIDLLLKSCDCLRLMFQQLQEKEEIDSEVAELLQVEFEKILENRIEAGGSEARSEVLSETIGAWLDEADEESSDSAETVEWQIVFRPKPELLQTGNEPARLIRELEQLGDIQVTAFDDRLPDFPELVADECYLYWVINLVTQSSEEEILEIFDWVIDECDLEIKNQSLTKPLESTESIAEEEKVESSAAEAVRGDSIKVESKQADASGASRKKSPDLKANDSTSNANTGSIRVAIDKVDSLINLVGELVITQSMLSELGNNYSPENMEKMNNGLEQLLQNTKELQESVMRIRMLPISFAFNRFPRMIRDLSAKINKKIELKLSGETTELDKTVMEKINDPLVHLVRNAADHGIETVEDRIRANKPETGTINLDAYHKGGNIVIEITDDGKGLDPEKLLQKAIEKGIIKNRDEWPEDRVFELIFEPGFSTAKEISDISGRGVGMDVVRRNIKSLGGRIEIESEVGKGSLFRIFLPLTLAILDGQLVRVGQETYVIPLISIVESLQIKEEMISHAVGSMTLYRLREDNVPIIPLYREFDIEADNKVLANGLLVVVESEGIKVGLLVDDLLAQQQVVIKSLESNYKKVTGISGATILGDGKVSLIIDVQGIITSALNKASAIRARRRNNRAA